MRTPVPALLRSLAASMIAAGGLVAAGAASPAAMAASALPAASCVHKAVQPFGLNARTDKGASALAKLTPRRGCGLAAAKGLRPSVISPRTAAASSNVINSVAATSATDAWAAGETITPTGVVPLTEHWDGSLWRAVPIPAPGPEQFGELFSVTAISASNAWAVGSYRTADGTFRPLVEHWDGTSWTIATTPAAVSGWFNSVTATSATSAWAVGVTVDGSGSARPLIEHWDGTAWSVAATPDPGSASILTSVTATSTTSALAVGSSGSLLNQQLAEQWTGTAWTIIPSTGSGTTPEAVAATSASNAWSVGAGAPQRWNGSAWTSVPVTNPLPGEIFFGVAATAANDAWAVGDYTIGTDGLGTAIVHWNGTSWSPVPSP